MPEEIPFAPPQELTEADRHLETVVQRLAVESIPTLEAHARQVVTLSTTLLAAFFGLLSLEQPPPFLARPAVRALAGLTLVGFFAALLCGLDALLPRGYRVPLADLTAQRDLLDRLLRRKEAAVRRATYLFGLAAGLMLLTALAALLGG